MADETEQLYIYMLMPEQANTSGNIYLLLGSNLGDPARQLAEAMRQIEQKIGRIKRRSSLYQTAAWGKMDQPDFINQVIIIESKLEPADCMQSILNIEQQMGRVRTVRNAARVIDIDILYYGKRIIHQPNLDIPHPRISQRRFVLVPLQELSPRFKDPLTGKTIQQMLAECTDELGVKKM